MVLAREHARRGPEFAEWLHSQGITFARETGTGLVPVTLLPEEWRALFDRYFGVDEDKLREEYERVLAEARERYERMAEEL
jgi:hypothetical protein